MLDTRVPVVRKSAARVLGMLVLLLLPFMAQSAMEQTAVTNVVRLISYNQFGSGDVVFTVKNLGSNCIGYWINRDDAGFEANLSMLLAAYHAKTRVKVAGLDDQKWSGSNSLFCKLYAIEYAE
ncbi:hypothetical protein LZP73_13250 [Shewanella sp. AS16]|uniref:hypothetical protein n=1 Tax=Shewanella sp. AS16 TaxID=2907625 RepID=UPI001F40AF28|nr:hypothetical protein [Shewanella sp. AS16]MCE9687159.1 hypothetical protein [Shewanella sp. AS16]